MQTECKRGTATCKRGEPKWMVCLRLCDLQRREEDRGGGAWRAECARASRDKVCCYSLTLDPFCFDFGPPSVLEEFVCEVCSARSFLDRGHRFIAWRRRCFARTFSPAPILSFFFEW